MRSLTIELPYHVACGRRGTRRLIAGAEPVTPPGRIPRLSKLLALALHLDRLIRDGKIRDQAELARLGHVSRARVSQILQLVHLAPDVLEEILFLPPTRRGRDPLTERCLRPLAAENDWAVQRKMWKKLRARLGMDEQ